MLLLALLLFTLVLRYPMVEHERYQADSYFIHRLSQSIVNEGRALWTFNSLSYIGYYPFSYPSGTPFFIADLALLTGLSVETTILVSGVLFGMMFCLAAFCIAREFLSDSRFILVATLFMVLGSRFIDTTYWVGSARGPLVVLMILSVFVVFRASSLRRPLLLPIAVVLAFGCLALHHMAVLYLFFGIAFVIASLGADFVVEGPQGQGIHPLRGHCRHCNCRRVVWILRGVQRCDCRIPGRISLQLSIDICVHCP